ncbi:TIGR03364 family FAD-dependent oxidoreductase [Zavarzinia sp. CC-PAN008]|uniref:TIGR03364 family FAD-dependent oxidoreductase n=1 Tax=Zavarzinia sp. CC-PAN008 TaxID=3243332 RepID=UPI003F7422B8
MAVYDLAVVGAGILGLAHALAAVRRGKTVVVIDREAQANGASIRNFGFVTVTGQERGLHWRRALRSRDIWAEVAPQAGIPIVQQGLLMIAQRPEALAVAEALVATEMGQGLEILDAATFAARFPHVQPRRLAGALYSPHERRVESPQAIPLLAAWLEQTHGVTFLRSTLVRDVAPPRIETTRGVIEAEAAVVCPGDDFLSLFPQRIAAHGLRRCQLHMMRVRPPAGWILPHCVMSDLSLVRYEGYADLPQAAPLRTLLAREQGPWLENGIHLIAVQNADGTLVVGDSHHYGDTLPPFAAAGVDDLILQELLAVTGLPWVEPVSRWVGTYASSDAGPMLRDAPSDAVRLVIVTGGTGASTGFAIGEETIAELYGPA